MGEFAEVRMDGDDASRMRSGRAVDSVLAEKAESRRMMRMDPVLRSLVVLEVVVDSVLVVEVENRTAM